jgi:hypothetical protein
MTAANRKPAGALEKPVTVLPEIECERCGERFMPRSRPGGRPRRFCSPACRIASHRNEANVTSEANVTANVTSTTPEPSGDFDWDDAEAVVLHEQPETAVYWNPNGDLVIRQRRWPDDDVFVVITEGSVDRFLDRLTDICGIPSVGGPA